MNARIALIWFSCFCCASENFRLMPAASAASLIDLVFAVRHSLSAPICEKPSVIFLSARTVEDPVSASAEIVTNMTAENLFGIAVLTIGCCHDRRQGRWSGRLAGLTVPYCHGSRQHSIEDYGPQLDLNAWPGCGRRWARRAARAIVRGR